MFLEVKALRPRFDFRNRLPDRATAVDDPHVVGPRRFVPDHRKSLRMLSEVRPAMLGRAGVVDSRAD